ncbi:MRN complex-interacting protein [Rhinoraja longicauda]
MAQQFQALRCCFCTTFQVQQVKKSKTWNCKLCAEKQSVLKVYGLGSGADCRKHVQRLNMLQGLKMQAVEATTWPTEEAADSSQYCQPQAVHAESGQSQAASRWNVYLDQKPVEETKEEGGAGDDEIVYTDRQRFQADMKNAGKDRSKRKRGSHFDSEKLPHPYGDRTDINAKETAGMKKKHVDSSMIEGSKWSSDTGEERDNLNQSNSTVQLADKSQRNEGLLTKRPEASKWDKFLPLSNVAGSEFSNEDVVSCGQPAWEQHSAIARLPLADEDDEAVSATPASVLLTTDPEPRLSPTTQTAVEKTQPVMTATVERVEGASEVMDSSGLCDCIGVSIKAGGARKDCQAQVPSTVSIYRAARVSSSLSPGTSLSLLVSTPHQRSAGESPQSAPGLTSKQPCPFVSLFQTDEDFDL